jgi:hypothetical protein
MTTVNLRRAYLTRPGMLVAPISLNRSARMTESKRQDLNRNGIADDIEPPIPDVTASRTRLADRLESNQGTDPRLSGGDVDARWEDAESGGDETVGGSMATPGQNDVDEIGRAVGLTYADTEQLRTGEKRENRDRARWELDPASSEDYADRTKDQD